MVNKNLINTLPRIFGALWSSEKFWGLDFRGLCRTTAKRAGKSYQLDPTRFVVVVFCLQLWPAGSGVITGNLVTLPRRTVNTGQGFFRKPKSMKREKSPSVSPEMAAHIKFLIKERGLFQHQAAALVGVNQGRISEIVNGKIHPDVPSAQGSFPF